MKKAVLKICILGFALLWTSSLKGQEVQLDFTFDQIFDNREYFSDYAFAQTIFGTRFDVQAGFRLDSTHSVSAGINYMFENGGKILGISPTVDLYYSYSGKQLQMNFGSFPRRDLLDLPLYMLTDTLNYYRPNIEGMMLSYGTGIAKLMAFADWTGRVSETQRETFLLGIGGTVGPPFLHLDADFIMYHNARSRDPLDSLNLQDNGILSVQLGADLSDKNQLDILRLSAGYLASYDRFRPDPYHWGGGWVANLHLQYNIFGLKGVYYNGDPVQFMYSDPFYTSGNYGRVDLYVDPFRHKHIKAKIGWNLHFVGNEGIHNSQQVLITVRF